VFVLESMDGRNRVARTRGLLNRSKVIDWKLAP